MVDGKDTVHQRTQGSFAFRVNEGIELVDLLDQPGPALFVDSWGPIGFDETGAAVILSLFYMLSDPLTGLSALTVELIMIKAAITNSVIEIGREKKIEKSPRDISND